MDKERFQKLSKIFESALSLESSLREQFVSAQCGEDEELKREVARLLLHHEDTEGVLEETQGEILSPQADLLRSALEEESSEPEVLPSHIGSYKIVRRIGQGGMGIVYEALQQNPERTVALKVISARYATEASLKRFEYESYVLGQLQHGGIAQVYEAGTAQSREGIEPFFAMELVHGERLTEYSAPRKLNLRDNLELVRQICEAIHHAHQKGIVHRDLKPGNILVTSAGEPKILDFGIARAVDDGVRQESLHTGTGEIIGTLAYMSPEQASGDPALVDTRSDIYSLGIILYELLAGHLPFNVETTSLFDALRSIRDEEPPRLGHKQPSLRGDVETIVHTALAKEKDRRYASAAELAADIGRFLRNEPISAHPPSTAYQMRKFAARNKALVGGAVAVLIVLLAGIATSTWYAFEARRESKISKQRLSESMAVTDFLQRTLGGADPYAVPRDTTLSEILRGRTLDLDEREEMAPGTRAALLESIAMAYYGVGFYEDAERDARRALELRRSAGGGPSPEVAQSLWNLAHILQRQGRYDEVREVLEEILVIKEALSDSPDLLVASVFDLLSAIFWFTDTGDAVATQRRALEIRQALLPGDDLAVVATLHHLGRFLSADDPEEAETLLKASIAMARRVHTNAPDAGQNPDFDPDYNLDVSLAQERLGEHYLNHKRSSAALSILAPVLKTRGELLPVDHPDLATTTAITARVYGQIGDSQKALTLAEEALRIRQKIYPAAHRQTAESLRQVGELTRQTGNVSRSREHLEAALAMTEQVTPEGHFHRAQCLSSLAETLAWQGDFEAALGHQERALKIYRSSVQGGQPSRSLGARLSYTASLYLRSGDFPRAHDYVTEALAHLNKTRGPEHPDTLHAEALLANSLSKIEPQKAEGILRRVIPKLDEALGESSISAGQSRFSLATLLLSRGEFSESEGILRSAQTAFEKALGAAHADSLRVKSRLGQCLLSLERPEEAEPLLLDCYAYSGRNRNVRAAIDLLLLHYGGDPARQAALQSKLQAADSIRRESSASPLEVVTTLDPVLEGGPFKTPDRRVRHALSYWQLREDGANYLLNPTYAQVSRKELTTLRIPAGVVLPSRTYHWRVLYVGSDSMAIGFTPERAFRTAELPLEIVRFDLQKAFNRDIVANPDDDQDDAFDGDRRGLMLVHGFGAPEAKKQKARGLPPDRRVGVHELGDYSDPNSIQLSADDADPVRLSCRPHRSILLRFLVSGGNGDSVIPIQLEHSDGTRSESLVHCDDWFHDHPPDNIGYLHAGVTPIHNGMDRLFMGALDKVNDPALFEALVEVTTYSPLETVVLLPAEGRFDDPKTTRFNLLAVSSVEKRD